MSNPPVFLSFNAANVTKHGRDITSHDIRGTYTRGVHSKHKCGGGAVKNSNRRDTHLPRENAPKKCNLAVKRTKFRYDMHIYACRMKYSVCMYPKDGLGSCRSPAAKVLGITLMWVTRTAAAVDMV